MKAVQEADPALSKSDPAFKAACVLLASANLGPEDLKIAHLMGLPLEVVSEFGDRLRKCGIWKNGKVHVDWSGEDGEIAFWMDCLVATGVFKRA